MAKAAKPQDVAADVAIVLYGRDESDRPHAAWFGKADAELAEKAAGLMGMHVLPVTTADQRAAAQGLPAGRVFASGRAFMPFCAAALYDRLSAFEGAYKPEPTAASVDPLPEPANVAATWGDIGLHSLVLAADGESSGWYEAIVVEARGELFALRWVAWPDLPPFLRRQGHLSLLSAEAHKGAAEAA